jgi:hypothetical protein
MSNSQRALAASHTPPKPNNGVGEMPKHEQSISEQYRLIAEEWADVNAAANLLEETKTLSLGKLKQRIIAERGEMPDNRAERIAKCLPEWEEYVRKMCDCRAKADKLRVRMEYFRMRFSEWQSREANHRHEARLTR